jgi:hypothetical protein
MKRIKRVLAVMVLAGMIVGWFQASESTRRYLKHIGRQVPYLPYRYFI